MSTPSTPAPTLAQKRADEARRHPFWPFGVRTSLYALTLGLAMAAVLVLLSACGGGGCDSATERCDDASTTQPVDCKATPERCR